MYGLTKSLIKPYNRRKGVGAGSEMKKEEAFIERIGMIC